MLHLTPPASAPQPVLCEWQVVLVLQATFMLVTSSMPMAQLFLEQVLWDIPDQQVPDIQDQQVPDIQDQQVVPDHKELQVIQVVPELQDQQDTQVVQVLWQDILVQLELQVQLVTVEVLVLLE
jgi:hypothetical protein